MSADEQALFLQRLAEDLNSKNITLPSFPDVVVKIRTALEDPTCSSERLAAVVRTDAVLVARLLMAANSAFHNRAGIDIVDLDLAISRLGFEVVRNTAIALAVEQIFAASKHENIKSAIEEIWHTSLSLASMSFVVARHSGKLNPDNAFLCGLLHQIGKLYILTHAQEYPALMGNPESLKSILEQWYASIGKSIVDAWGFPDEIAASLDLEDGMQSNADAPPTLVDVVFTAQRLLDDALTLDTDAALQDCAGKLMVNSDSYPTIEEAYQLHAQSTRSSVS